MSASNAMPSRSGALRESLGVVGNLAQVLGSRNVGPKAIAAALPEVLKGAALLEATLGDIFADVPTGERPEARAAVFDFASHQAQDLTAGLRSAVSERRLTAGPRLRLERCVRRVEHGLSGVLLVLELLEASRGPRRWLDLEESVTLSRPGDYPAGPHARSVGIELSGGLRQAVLADPRAALGLVSLAVACLEPMVRAQDHVVLRSVGPGQIELARGPADAGPIKSRLVAPPSTGVCWPGLVWAGGAFDINMERRGETIVLSWESRPNQ